MPVNSVTLHNFLNDSMLGFFFNKHTIEIKKKKEQKDRGLYYDHIHMWTKVCIQSVHISQNICHMHTQPHRLKHANTHTHTHTLKQARPSNRSAPSAYL